MSDMGMHVKWLIAMMVVVALVVLLALTGCAGDAPTDKTGVALAEESCGQCHSMARLYLLESSRDWDWAEIVPRMVDTHEAGVGGKKLSKRQQQDVIDALSSREPTAGEVAVLKNCTQCHSIDTVAGRYAITMWDHMMDRMETSYGADFSDEDRASMTEFFEWANVQAHGATAQ